MPKGRPEVASTRVLLANGTGDERRDRRKALDPFTKELLAHTGARVAFERLEAAGISREVTSAFLYLTTSCQERFFRHTLPRPEHLRAAAARVYHAAEEISAFNRNGNLTVLKQYPALEDAYGHMFALLPGALRAYSQYLQVEAFQIGRVGKTKMSTRKLFLILMLEHVNRTSARHHYNEIACLMTAADALRGSNNVTEPAALKMLLKRYRASTNGSVSLRSLPKAMRDAFQRDATQVSETKAQRPTFGQRIGGLR